MSENQPDWLETVATVQSCTYQFARMNTLTLGLQTGERFRITFNYYAHGRLYAGEYQSRVAVPQNEQIIVRYNPLHPGQNDRSNNTGSNGGTLTAAGVLGAVLLSLLWLAMFRGCS